MSRLGLAGQARQVAAWLGRDGHGNRGRRGLAWPGSAWHGLAGQARHGRVGLVRSGLGSAGIGRQMKTGTGASASRSPSSTLPVSIAQPCNGGFTTAEHFYTTKGTT